MNVRVYTNNTLFRVDQSQSQSILIPVSYSIAIAVSFHIALKCELMLLLSETNCFVFIGLLKIITHLIKLYTQQQGHPFRCPPESNSSDHEVHPNIVGFVVAIRTAITRAIIISNARNSRIRATIYIVCVSCLGNY